ncbi:MAG: hydrolase 2, exosortase A system-associated [Oxalobacteraceae bacterium]
MKPSVKNLPAEPFFLKTGSGERFCLYHAPHPGAHCRGVFIYVHPFADEMNKSRRMAAMQARAFAAAGFGVLQIDLFGCGDSSGEFKDARWDIWKEDLALAMKWLVDHVSVPISLWGLRLGALLALDFAKTSDRPIEKIILWQPVISGESFLTQFLRLRLANEIFSNEKEKPAGTNTMRASLFSGETLEVAGYELSPVLASAIDKLKGSELVVTNSAIYWFEIVSESGRPMTPAGTRVISVWEQGGANLHVHLVSCAPFWTTQEISECQALVSATARCVMEHYDELQ